MPSLKNVHAAVEAIATYRMDLRQILEEHFSIPTNAAELKVSEFFASLTGEEATLVLHRERFLLAADLADVKWTDELAQRYKQYKKQTP